MTEFEALKAKLQALPEVKGIVPVDIISLPVVLGPLIRKLVRSKTVNLSKLADALEMPSEHALVLADILVEKGYLLEAEEEDGDERTFGIRYARMPKRNIPFDL